jgi:hypothetical protein
MNFADIVIVSLLIIIIGLLIYFSFIKNRGDPCRNCPYCKKCDKSSCSNRGKCD